VFAAAPALLWALKIGGGLYLIWMAMAPVARCRPPRDRRRAPRAALAAVGLPAWPFTQLANPKPAVMFSAIFLGTVPQGTPLLGLSRFWP
jgi:threonine/homoserine/homoserine lactone efflux protein